MTARIQSELTALEGQRLMMLEVRDMRLASGGYSDPGRVAVTAAAIADIDEKIAALRKTVADRLAAQTAADSGSGRRATDRIVAAIEALPGQHGAPQDVTIVQPNPLPVTQDPGDDVHNAGSAPVGLASEHVLSPSLRGGARPCRHPRHVVACHQEHCGSDFTQESDRYPALHGPLAHPQVRLLARQRS